MTPASARTSSPPAYKLYDPKSVIIATLFGSPVAGAALMAWNERRYGSTRSAMLILAIGVAVTALAIACGSLVPSYEWSAVAVGLAVAMLSFAKSVQGNRIRQHMEKGGRLHSRSAAFALGIACLAIIYIAVSIASLLAQRPASNAAPTSKYRFIASVDGSIGSLGNDFPTSNPRYFQLQEDHHSES